MRTTPLFAAAVTAVAWLAPIRSARADATRFFADTTPGAAPDARVHGWSRELGATELRTPTWNAGLLFVGGGVSSRDVYALDARTGALAWRASLSDVGPSAAAFVDGRVVLVSESCHVHVLDAATGAIVWERRVGEFVNAVPAVAGGRVYVVHSEASSGSSWALTALSLDDGIELFTQPLAHDAIGAVVVAGDDVLVTTADGVVHAFDAARGDVLWSASAGGAGAPVAIGDAVETIARATGGERVEVAMEVTFPTSKRAAASALLDAMRRSAEPLWSCPFGGTVAIGVSGTRTSVRALRSDDDGMRRCLSAAFGTRFDVGPGADRGDPGFVLQLHADRGAQHVVRIDRRSGERLPDVGTASLRSARSDDPPSGWAYDGARAAVSDGVAVEVIVGVIRARDAAGGAVLWSKDVGTRSTLPAVAGDVVVHGLESGDLVVRDRATGDVRRVVAIGAALRSQPIVADGRVYGTTSTGTVYAVELPEVLGATYAMWGGSPGH